MAAVAVGLRFPTSYNLVSRLTQLPAVAVSLHPRPATIRRRQEKPLQPCCLRPATPDPLQLAACLRLSLPLAQSRKALSISGCNFAIAVVQHERACVDTGRRLRIGRPHRKNQVGKLPREFVNQQRTRV